MEVIDEIYNSVPLPPRQ